MTAYIGFQRLDEFVAALDREHPVYCAPLSIVKSGDHIETCTVSIVASQPQRDRLIYCKIDTSRWQEIHGQPFGHESEQRANRAKHLQLRMRGFIAEALRADNPDLDILDGVPSFPAGLILVPGHIDGVTYDADLREFVKEEAAA